MPSGSGSGNSKHQTRNATALAVFQEKDKCLVFHKDQLYEAKVVRVDETGNKYLVHYNGYGNRHDEWKSHADLLRVTEENRKKQQELRKKGESPEPSADRGKSGRGAVSKDKDATTPASSRKQNAAKTTTGDGVDNSDLSSGRPDSPDSVKSEMSSSSSVKGGTTTTTTAASDNKQQKNTSSTTIKTPQRSTRDKDSSSNQISEERSSKKRLRRDEITTTAQTNTTTANSPEAKKPNLKHDPDPTTHDSKTTANTKSNDASSSNLQSPDGKPKEKATSVEMPDSLKVILVDDYDSVVRQKMLVDVMSPKSIPVVTIINDFVLQSTDESAHHVAYGVKDLFDVVLGSNLLYKFERPQYDEIINMVKEKKMSEVYGAEHFLRFFLKINEFMKEAKLGKNYLSTIVPYLNSMLSYLKNNGDKYFDAKSRYVPSTADYLRKSITDYDQ